MSLIPGVQLVRRADGSVAQLHALGMLKDGSRWLAYGEIKTGGSRFGGICCYATEDFVHWHDLGCALPVGAPGGMTSPERIVERPRVLRCPANGLYVMYLHVDGEGDYRYAHVGTAVSERPEGPFRPLSTMRFGMNASRDIFAFQDWDGSGYLVSEDRDQGTHIYRLSRDYLSLVEDLVCLRGQDGRFGYESPILLHRGDWYYWFGSQLTGWDCNDNMVSVSRDLRGPWSPWKPVAPLGTQTYQSQCDAIVPLSEDPALPCLYIGDRWRPDHLGESPLVTLPILINEGCVRLLWREQWNPEKGWR